MHAIREVEILPQLFLIPSCLDGSLSARNFPDSSQAADSDLAVTSLLETKLIHLSCERGTCADFAFRGQISFESVFCFLCTVIIVSEGESDSSELCDLCLSAEVRLLTEISRRSRHVVGCDVVGCDAVAVDDRFGEV